MPSNCQLPEEIQNSSKTQQGQFTCCKGLPEHLLDLYLQVAPTTLCFLLELWTVYISAPVFPSGVPIGSVASGLSSLLLLFGHFNFLFPCPSSTEIDQPMTAQLYLTLHHVQPPRSSCRGLKNSTDPSLAEH